MPLCLYDMSHKVNKNKAWLLFRFACLKSKGKTSTVQLKSERVKTQSPSDGVNDDDDEIAVI
jgi:hypothetical protein